MYIAYLGFEVLKSQSSGLPIGLIIPASLTYFNQMVVITSITRAINKQTNKNQKKNLYYRLLLKIKYMFLCALKQIIAILEIFQLDQILWFLLQDHFFSPLIKQKAKRKKAQPTYFNNKVASLMPHGAGKQQRSSQKEGEKFNRN